MARIRSIDGFGATGGGASSGQAAKVSRAARATTRVKPKAAKPITKGVKRLTPKEIKAVGRGGSISKGPSKSDVRSYAKQIEQNRRNASKSKYDARSMTLSELMSAAKALPNSEFNRLVKVFNRLPSTKRAARK